MNHELWQQPIGPDRTTLWLRQRREALTLDRQTARIALETSTDLPPITNRATPAGDERKLRGIPAIGRGVQGAIPGTRP